VPCCRPSRCRSAPARRGRYRRLCGSAVQIRRPGARAARACEQGRRRVRAVFNKPAARCANAFRPQARIPPTVRSSPRHAVTFHYQHLGSRFRGECRHQSSGAGPDHRDRHFRAGTGSEERVRSRRFPHARDHHFAEPIDSGSESTSVVASGCARIAGPRISAQAASSNRRDSRITSRAVELNQAATEPRRLRRSLRSGCQGSVSPARRENPAW
jgi:hypothetical protein